MRIYEEELTSKQVMQLLTKLKRMANALQDKINNLEPKVGMQAALEKAKLHHNLNWYLKEARQVQELIELDEFHNSSESNSDWEIRDEN